ncbi:unnamed protein product [Symbiodinium necroappetens]|uniref:Uncharacterized protein n=1 Tax=Symbiodinium necroappetens TaxID=1628268 RepID=A0A812K9Q6_9DINO|nr:unnamed protein product [Symbiodinium necroappetens]
MAATISIHKLGEDRIWERLWNIADIKLRCLRNGIRGSHLDLVSNELGARGIQDTNCFLTHSELSLLCTKLCRRWTPVVEVTPDFHASEETGDHTMLALAAAGLPVVDQVNVDVSDMDALRDAGRRLHEQGFRLITVEPVAEGRPDDRSRPSFDELRQMRPLIIHLGTHYFLLDSVDELPESLSLEEGLAKNDGNNRRQSLSGLLRALWEARKEQPHRPQRHGNARRMTTMLHTTHFTEQKFGRGTSKVQIMESVSHGVGRGRRSVLGCRTCRSYAVAVVKE